ncbi:MAG: tetratricopeptide repeat protein [Limisphaerales bacterium]
MFSSPSSPIVPAGTNCCRRWWQAPAVCLLLAAITFAVFGQTLGHDFVNFDDDRYVYVNPVVKGGLSLKGLEWVIAHADCQLYHPLTMLSLMADHQFHGLHAGGYHLTNVLLHTASVILLFLILRLMTGATWRSAFVAAMFAIHPLRVESVAWVAERKDVLSAFFFMLTLGAYAHYVRKPDSLARYLMVAAAFVMALLSKPTVVMLPFVLLLLDYWPLNRFEQPRKFSGLILEKIPLLALAGAACVMTVLAAGKAIAIHGSIPMPARLGNAVVSCAVYLRQMVWPQRLAVFYPPPDNGQPLWTTALSFLLLALISWGVMVFQWKRRWLLTGWLWYLGMLAPVIGLVQAGTFAHADRNTYLPQIGICLAMTWLVAEWRVSRAALGGLMAAVIGLFMVCAWQQTSCWRNSGTLWTHVIACAPGNYIAQYNLGDYLVEKGKLDEAMTHYQKAVDINPKSAEAHNNLGLALGLKGKVDQAIDQYQLALHINPHLALAHYNLGNVFLQFGKLDDAISQYQQALQSEPDHAVILVNLANAFQQKGNLDRASAYYRQALQIDPDDPKAHNNLGEILLQKSSLNEAIVHFQKALQLDPGDARVHNNLGSALLQQGRVDEAITQYREALKTDPNDAKAQDNLGILLLGKDDAEEAIIHFQKALQINPRNANAENNLGNAFLQKGNVGEAVAHFERALAVEPDEPAIQNNLAWLFATAQEASLRNGAKAVELARQANTLTGGKNPTVLRTLAAAYAEAGRFPEAMETVQRALMLAETQSNSTLAGQLQSELELYQAGKPIP